VNLLVQMEQIFFNLSEFLLEQINDWTAGGFSPASPHGEVNRAQANHAQAKYKLHGVRRNRSCVDPLPEACHVTCCGAR
jgi:hypothetical protein